MKSSGTCKQGSWHQIIKNRVVSTFILSQAEYIKKILARFSMQDAKLVSTLLARNFWLSKDLSFTTEAERAHIDKSPYVFVIGSFYMQWFIPN